MWCLFEGGNLDQTVMEVDDDDIDRRSEPWKCSPEQPRELVRSHGWCVYADSGRKRVSDGHQLWVFEHHGDWTSYDPPHRRASTN